VVVEAAVLDGDHGVLHVMGDLVGPDLVAALVVEPGEGIAVAVGDGGDEGEGRVGVDVPEVLVDGVAGLTGDQRGSADDGQRGDDGEHGDEQHRGQQAGHRVVLGRSCHGATISAGTLFPRVPTLPAGQRPTPEARRRPRRGW